MRNHQSLKTKQQRYWGKMSKKRMTTAEINTELLQHEAVCAERYQMILFRINRLERILMGSAAAIIAGLVSIIVTLTT